MKRERSMYMVGKLVAMGGAGVLIMAIPKFAHACAPYGLIGADWSGLGGSSGPLGNCTDNEQDNGLGGRIETFQYGYINWTGSGKPDSSQAYAVYGAIGAAWHSRYGYLNMGQPITNEQYVPLPSEVGDFSRMNTFYNESLNAINYLVWNPGNNVAIPCENSDRVCNVYGTIGQAWYYSLGYEVTDEFVAQADWIVGPVDEAYSVTGGAQQDFTMAGGGTATITWNSSNNVACVYDGPNEWVYNGTGSQCLRVGGN